MKSQRPPQKLEDVELEADAAELLEQAAKHAFRQQPVKPGHPQRVQSLKPKAKKPIRRP